MKKIFLVILVAVIFGFAVIKLNLIPGISDIFSATKQENKKAIYFCPMHPTYTSDRPGDCPICSMKLVKKEKKEKTKIVKRKMNHKEHDIKMPMEETSEQFKLEIDPAKQQYIGIKTTKAILKDAQKEIKTLGIVTPDETRLSHIHTKFSGYIEKVFADYEGKLVEKGQPLFTVYSPELVSTQEEYLLALEAQETFKKSKYEEIDKAKISLLDAARRRLELWDISHEQINNLEETKKVTKELTIYSSVNGFIIKREAFEGKEITPNDKLYDVADLSNVWILVEVYETDLLFVRVGQTAKVNFTYENIQPITGKITYIYPTIDPTTRTLKVRLEVSNPSYKLKPDMYVDATLLSNLGTQITIPQRAVIDSGERQIVFVKQGEGTFIPKEVTIGPEVNNERIVYSGIKEGEEVVTDGNFLLDSESNLQTALEQFNTMHKH